MEGYKNYLTAGNGRDYPQQFNREKVLAALGEPGSDDPTTLKWLKPAVEAQLIVALGQPKKVEKAPSITTSPEIDPLKETQDIIAQMYATCDELKLPRSLNHEFPFKLMDPKKDYTQQELKAQFAASRYSILQRRLKRLSDTPTE